MTTQPDDGTVPEPAPGWRIGAVRGVPVYIGRSWPVVAVVIVATFTSSVARAVPGIGWGATLVAAAYALLLLLSVLAHEAGHALVAQAFGHRVHRIVADLWGGHTTYQADTNSPGRSALVAVAGPLMNALLAALAFLATGLTTDPVPSLLVGALFFSNAFVAVFNLLPGLPLDGGFLVDAVVWKATGSRARGQLVAGWTGRLVAIGVVLWFVVLPFLRGRTPDLFAVLWMALIASFLWQGASAAIRGATVQQRLGEIDLRSVIQPVAVVHLDEPIATAVDRLSRPTHGEPPVPVAFDAAGRPVGLVGGELDQVPPHARVSTPVSAAVLSLPHIPVITWHDGLTTHDIVVALNENESPLLLVHDGRGTYGAVLAHGLAERLAP